MIGGHCGHLPFNGSCMQMLLEVASNTLTILEAQIQTVSLYTSQIMVPKCELLTADWVIGQCV